VTQAAIYGLSGPELTDDERAFFADADPAGYILFRRNCETPEQVLRLTDALRSIQGRDDLPILIDQEGGRVARMRPPYWPAFPAGERFAELFALAPASAIEAARSNARAIALVLRASGVNVNCLPMLDVRQEGADDIVGDRALGSQPMQVSALGRAMLDGMASAGVVGVMKHIPGHGRALVDSHKALPVVEATDEELAVDLEPFERLAHAPMAMVAHVLYTAWDAERPASQSPIVIDEIIRKRIGFDGFLMSDDSNMGALTGSQAERAAACVAAGCDVALPCNGVLEDNIAIAKVIGEISPEGAQRLERAMAGVQVDDDGADLAQSLAKRDELLALA
jgi:beta-N-acetylhexosaminidase